MTIPPSVRNRPRWRVAVLALRWSAAAVVVLAPSAVLAQGMATASPALGMAVPLSAPGMAEGGTPAVPTPASADARQRPGEGRATAVVPGRRRSGGLGSGFADAAGRLPNQRIGRRHEHVVRDICIGC